MMMAQKHLLHELLKEDQEPFLLKNYISDRKSQLKYRPSPKTSLQLKKQKSNHQIQNSNFPGKFCKSTYFFSTFPNTPDITKSPLVDFAKSPCKSPNNSLFLHIPARTASLLLEAALRIQKKKTQNKNRNFSLFGSLFKRLTHRNRNRKREIENVPVKVDSSIVVAKFPNGSKKGQEKMDSIEMGFLCSANGRPSSAVWSESNEDKSLDMETCTSTSDDYEEIDFVAKQREYTERSCFDDNGFFFCESPFRFVLERRPTSGQHTPELATPVVSPSRHRTEEKESDAQKSFKKFQSEEQEEEKEQCSPVSVLDPPFEDYDDDGHKNDDEEERFDMECSYASLQRTKQQLLYKLRRFEKLAELDPVELEKRMQDQEESETFTEEDDCEDVYSETSYKEKHSREIVYEVDERLGVPEDLKQLVSDLITEEGRELESSEDRDMLTRRVCRRLELWKEVESNTIDMMIEEDFCREEVEWKKNAEQIRELAGELELAIFGFLLQEFSDELACEMWENFEAAEELSI